MINNKIYDTETNFKNNLIVAENYISNNVIDYPRTMCYYPTLVDNVYTIRITDERLQIINNPIITLTLPEVKGRGIVAYKKYYPFHLINKIDIYYFNRENENKILFNSYDSEELLMNILSNVCNEKYLNYTSGKNDDYCKEKEGYYSDCVIFEKRTIAINLDNIFKNLSFFPNIDVIFEIKLNDIKDIIYYNIEFETQSLRSLIETFKNTNLNMKLEFTNNILAKTEEEKNKLFQHERTIIRKKKTIGQSGSTIMKSETFNNCIIMTFYNKIKHFKENNKFISVMGNETNENKIINKWVKKILKDLIIVTDLDLSENKNKRKLGFDDKCIFTEVIDNKINFEDEKNSSCEIYIELVPENYKIYYHRNILTFSRRFNKNNELNVSKLFKCIKGIIYSDNVKNIEYNMENIKHDINIDIASIPVNIWSHVDNTSTKDLRSEQSKKEDFIYNNSFINGLDFLSKDKGYNKISVKTDKTNIESFNIDCKYGNNNYLNNCIKITELDKHFYPNIALVDFYNGNNKKLVANPAVNFDSLHVFIDWNNYPDYSHKSLYVFEPHLSIYEIMVIKFVNNEIIIKSL